jgi:WD40 repeat protein
VWCNTPVNGVSLSPDGALFATGNNEGIVEFWDTATGTSQGARIAGSGRVLGLSFQHDGHHLACGTDELIARVWDLGNEPGVISSFSLGPTYGDLAFDDSLTKAIAVTRGWIVDQWNIDSGKRTSSLQLYKSHEEPTPGRKVLAISPAGGLLAVCPPAGTLEIVEVATGKQTALLADDRGSFYLAAFVQNDRALLGIVDCAPNTLTWTAGVWDTATGRLLHKLPYYESELGALATHPNGNLFAISAGPNIRVYELFTGRLVAKHDGHSDKIHQLAFSPNGRLLVSAGSDGTARIWDWANGPDLRNLVGKYGATIHCCAFSPDGRTLVTADSIGQVKFWNTASGQEMMQLHTNFRDLWRLQFSTDGNRLACWSADPVTRGKFHVRVWSIERSPAEMGTTH